MEIGGISSQSASGGQKSDAAAQTQALERQRKAVEQQLKQLEQSKTGGDSANAAKDKLQKQLQEIDRQIQALAGQGTAAPAAEQPAQTPPARFDEYVKGGEETETAGLYTLEQDENGTPRIAFGSPSAEQKADKTE